MGFGSTFMCFGCVLVGLWGLFWNFVSGFGFGGYLLKLGVFCDFGG